MKNQRRGRIFKKEDIILKFDKVRQTFCTKHKGKRFKENKLIKSIIESLKDNKNKIILLIFVIWLIYNISTYIAIAKSNNKIIEIKKSLNSITEGIEDIHNNYITQDELDKHLETITNEINTTKDSVTEVKDKVTTISKAKTETKITSRSSVERQPSTTNTEGYIAFTATGYCPCAKCCGKTNGITASGTKATANRTVAMSSSYKFGTKIEIKGMGTYIVEDRGGAIKGNKIDIYFNTHQEALNFGRRTVYLKVK